MKNDFESLVLLAVGRIFKTLRLYIFENHNLNQWDSLQDLKDESN